MYKHYRKPTNTKLLRDILEQYMKYGYLQSNFLSELLGDNVGKKYIVRKQRVMREKFGLIYRPRKQFECENSHYAFYIHALTKRGKDLAKELGINPPIVASITLREPEEDRGEFTETDIENGNFWHAMGIVNTLASFEIGAKKHAIRFISEGEIRKRFKETKGTEIDFDIPFDAVYNGDRVTGKRKRDFICGFTYTNGLSSFFLGENERDNPVDNPDLSRDGSSWLGKDIAYREIFKNKTYQSFLGVPNLKMLVTTKNKTKSHHQMELTETNGGTKHFMFKEIPDQKYTGKSPTPFPEILTEPWKRAGFDPVAIYTEPQ